MTEKRTRRLRGIEQDVFRAYPEIDGSTGRWRRMSGARKRISWPPFSRATSEPSGAWDRSANSADERPMKRRA